MDARHCCCCWSSTHDYTHIEVCVHIICWFSDGDTHKQQKFYSIQLILKIKKIKIILDLRKSVSEQKITIFYAIKTSANVSYSGAGELPLPQSTTIRHRPKHENRTTRNTHAPQAQVDDYWSAGARGGGSLHSQTVEQQLPSGDDLRVFGIKVPSTRAKWN